jgi:hypothetical protein
MPLVPNRARGTRPTPERPLRLFDPKGDEQSAVRDQLDQQLEQYQHSPQPLFYAPLLLIVLPSRLRLISAPASPGKALKQVGAENLRSADLASSRSNASTNSTTSPDNRASKRVSIAMTDIDILRDEADTRDRDFDKEGDAGTGNSISRYRASLLREGDRTTPTGGGNGARRRQPLPRDSREGGDEGGGSANRRGRVNSVSHRIHFAFISFTPRCTGTPLPNKTKRAS